MTEISAMFVRKQVSEARNVSDKAKLFALVGLTEESARAPDARITTADYFTLLEKIAESEWPDPAFHMRVCAGMRCEEFGAVGLAMKSAPTLRHAFERMHRYARLYNSSSAFAVEDKGNVYCWTHRRPQPARLGNYLSNEAALATFLTLCRESSRPDLKPVRLQFAHRREGSTAALTDHFGIEPIFDQEIDGMQFAVEDVDRASPIGDLGIWKFFSDHLESTLPPMETEPDRLAAQVIEEVAGLLSGGVPQLAEVAGRLGLGTRTLQRRLSDGGKSYQELVAEARRRLARKLLRRSEYSLAEIAFLTGFSEQSAFTRAFKRGEGITPRAFRQSTLSTAHAG
ncbi:AraC family transcriptional regulator [Heliomarina baculiformis]|uniref:AraC family transcriptional regulator n=1 Tax=Heliomarina baculiformis TaxID=2872036 RepID=UPI001EE1D32A